LTISPAGSTIEHAHRLAAEMQAAAKSPTAAAA